MGARCRKLGRTVRDRRVRDRTVIATPRRRGILGTAYRDVLHVSQQNALPPLHFNMCCVGTSVIIAKFRVYAALG